MSRFQRTGIAVAALFAIAASAAAQSRGRSPDRATPVAPTPLRAVSSTPLSRQGYLAWAGAPRCGDDGTLYFLSVPSFDPGSAPEALSVPRDVLGLRADGKTVVDFRPGSVPRFARARSITTGSMALGPGGEVFLLVWVVDAEKDGRQYIVSFDGSGKHRQTLELPEEIAAGSVDVFGSGDFLLRGRRRQPDAERIAVLPSGGGTLRDVVGFHSGPVEEPFDLPRAAAPSARGPDGRILLAPPGEDTVQAVSPSGDAEQAFRLEPPARGRGMTGLMAAGSRVAVVYGDAEPEGDRAESGRYWIDVYDATLEARVASYGPLAEPPLCYQQRGSRDHFTVLGEGGLVEMAP